MRKFPTEGLEFIRFYFHSVASLHYGLSQRAAVDEIDEIEGEGTTTKSVAGGWHQFFNSEIADLNDKPPSVRSTKLNNGDLSAALKGEPLKPLI
ncbi:hypothetical protein KIN20_011701 [Parelaphostrongylus tenuis]|uniref:Mos1 transposase HTH domain-containing protein n=1 Tax=Parelaphostrongylus tenuis TaxID=148309 RepID=A0AAD5QMM9_PARTN|nr:hypothetical protein KIN20_011701 [Parelaphostrongylus tenuis]